MFRKHLAGRQRGKWRNGGWARHIGVNGGGRMRNLRRILRCEKGANAIEYALVASLISIAAIGAFNNLSGKINVMYNNVPTTCDAARLLRRNRLRECLLPV